MNAQERHERKLDEMDREHREFASYAYKAARERIGTQAEVARLLGVNRVTIAKRESGAMKLTWEASLAMRAIAPLRSPKRSRKSENDLRQARAAQSVDDTTD
jgi:DNA-binding XRE family transcriptional regulator